MIVFFFLGGAGGGGRPDDDDVSKVFQGADDKLFGNRWHEIYALLVSVLHLG